MGCGCLPVPVCAGCRARIAGPPRRVRHNGVPLWVGPDYEDAPRQVLLEFKRSGRMVLAEPWACQLQALLSLASARAGLSMIDGRGDILLVAAPSRRSARARRGFVPLELIARKAGVRLCCPFRLRARRSQRGLGERARFLNRQASLEPRHTAQLAGARVIVVDDVITTGATLAAVERACLAAGAVILDRAVLSRTPKKSPGSSFAGASPSRGVG